MKWKAFSGNCWNPNSNCTRTLVANHLPIPRRLAQRTGSMMTRGVLPPSWQESNGSRPSAVIPTITHHGEPKRRDVRRRRPRGFRRWRRKDGDADGENRSDETMLITPDPVANDDAGSADVPRPHQSRKSKPEHRCPMESRRGQRTRGWGAVPAKHRPYDHASGEDDPVRPPRRLPRQNLAINRLASNNDVTRNH